MGSTPMTKDEAFQQYEEEIERVDQQARAARNYARIVLREQLRTLRAEHHEELQAIRHMEQRTKRRERIKDELARRILAKLESKGGKDA